jgi:hypothetical protein
MKINLTKENFKIAMYYDIKSFFTLEKHVERLRSDSDEEASSQETLYSRYNEFKFKFRLAMICLKEENIASVRNMIDDDGRIA